MAGPYFLSITVPTAAYDVGDSVHLKARFGTNETRLDAEAAAGTTAFIVTDITGYSTGDLVIVNPGGMTEERNTLNTLTGRAMGFSSAWVYPHHIRERLWERTDPTATTLKVKGPSGTTGSYSTATGQISSDAVGVFSYDLGLASAGQYYYQWTGAGSVVAVAEGQFVVSPSQFAT